MRVGSEAGLGDVWAGMKASLRGEAEAGGNLGVRAAVKLPTGRLPFGSEETDVGCSVMAGWVWRRTSLRMQLDGVVPTSTFTVVHIATRAYATGNLGFTWVIREHVALQLQASGHLSPLERTRLAAADRASAYVLGGVTVSLSRTVSIDAGIVENVFSPYRGADVAVPLRVNVRL